jgi:hypothetical protein
MSVDAMAEKADKQLGASYANCYLIPTYHSHPTALGLESRLKFTEDGFTFRDTTERETRKAVLYGHGRLLRLLRQQNDYFQLGLDAEIDAQDEAFVRIWSGKTAA